ncbi:MAG: excinuclease ABC subunit A [Bacteroidetes bacterium GWF2_38_335]|nr:MAG: excinuclease ABC subunit A [Bacteroidetes bacterium GWF2_38_335]OFY77853.1 MAG: excinuclease ABC subunit A [Bacteroidetes bacterium RIFOXYA12_FULL_38_20]
MSQIKNISIKGARVHNLKNVNVTLPRDKFIVITGLSGSGKSSLAFDTLYAEGQRRYVESLSSYARQFLGRINKPEVDLITGIPPAIAIEQKVNTRNPRSTVGTSTEIYDYIKLLFARCGKTFSPVSGKIVKKHSVTDVVNFLLEQEPGSKILILSPFLTFSDRTEKEQLENLSRQGYSRLEIDGEINKIEEVLSGSVKVDFQKQDIFLLIDRPVVQNDEETLGRIADSVQLAFHEGRGECTIKVLSGTNALTNKFSSRYEADGIEFEEPSVHLFSFNNPIGACPKCEGYGSTIGIDEDLVIPNKSLSVYEDAVVCWKGEKMSKWKEKLIFNAMHFDFPVHKPYYQLSDEQRKLLWKGNKWFKGIDAFFKHVEEKSYKIQYRVLLSRYRGKTVCPVCNGTRLKPEAGYVKVGGITIQELVLMPIHKLKLFFDGLILDEHDAAVAKRLLVEIKNRIDYLMNVGLEYLNLNRLSSTLSGGESQRINLATSLGSSLVGSLYILDEPSIGLHPRDTQRLIGVLNELKKLGNTVVVVEHDEEIILSSDHIVDIGPKAGRFGGEVVFEGSKEDLIIKNNTLTANYITGTLKIETPKDRRPWCNFIEVIGARENNLKNIDVKFPLNVMTVVTGVSGSGKSSLVNKVFYLAVQKFKGGYGEKTGQHAAIQGDLHMINEVEMVDQNPIGKSSRSNPVTYLKAFDEIRNLYAVQQASKINGFKASHFSFNTDGGRCDECQGDGNITVEMQFMADVHLVCESCKGKRYKDEVLEVEYNGKSIYDVLEMTINEAIEFFGQTQGNMEKKIIHKLKPLADVGLGYIKLGQASSTLSGGESQRVKLAFFLSKEKAAPSLFIFDEPTTGLHFHDISKLLQSLNELIKRGHTVVIIEHNPEVIKSADWIIDLGPEGGDKGGYVLFEGTPEDLKKCEASFTAGFVKV